LEGVDVSSHESNVDWGEVKRSGREFAFARFSYGLELDTEFEANWGEMKKAGLVRGAYQYFRPSKNAAKQAKLMADWYNDKLSRNEIGPGDLPVTLDIECNECRSRETLRKQVNKWMTTWIKLVKQDAGRPPIIYTRASFWDCALGNNHYGASPLWVAHYNTDCPGIPKPWTKWTFWQYTEKGSCPGIQGPADLIYFNGGISDLWTLSGSEKGQERK
jgi:lysozyme